MSKNTSDKADAIREFLAANPGAARSDVVSALKDQGIDVTPEDVSSVKRGSTSSKRRKSKAAKKKTTRRAGARKSKKPTTKKATSGASAKYPRHSIERALRVPAAILEQNAGKPCTTAQAAAFVGVRNSGPFRVEVSSANKYGFIDRPEDGKIAPSQLAKQILRPQTAEDELAGYRQGVLNAPQISDVYAHYRGENLPDAQFFKNTLVESFGLPEDKFEEFRIIFVESLERAQLITKHGGKLRVVDATESGAGTTQRADRLKKAAKGLQVDSTDSCFVMQPFRPPLGTYYESIYKPAIEKAGLTPVRADTDIFATGKIMDQVWRGITSAKVLVAELTSRNPNVFYELGVAHALQKPVVLVSSKEEDVPFDLQHIRVIYYDVNDPFWGQKLLDKVAENILSALRNPEEAVFRAQDEE